jgi:hypothetical protein
MNVRFKDWDCVLQFEQYHNGRTAILLIDAEDSSPIATATVNIPEASVGDDEVIIKDYSENSGMFNVLAMAGVIASDPVGFTSSGFIDNIPICKLLIDKV